MNSRFAFSAQLCLRGSQPTACGPISCTVWIEQLGMRHMDEWADYRNAWYGFIIRLSSGRVFKFKQRSALAERNFKDGSCLG